MLLEGKIPEKEHKETEEVVLDLGMLPTVGLPPSRW